MLNPLPQPTIAPASLHELGALDRIEQAAFNTPWSRELLRAAILSDQYRVRALHTEAEGLLGFYIAHPIKERTNLDNLAVDAAARNRGHGSCLIHDWIDHAQESHLRTLSLQVNTANKRAQQLYERFGFRTVKLLVSYYPNGDDAYQMERALQPSVPYEAGTVRRPTRRWGWRSR